MKDHLDGLNWSTAQLSLGQLGMPVHEMKGKPRRRANFGFKSYDSANLTVAFPMAAITRLNE
jgi:hypothetical protein